MPLLKYCYVLFACLLLSSCFSAGEQTEADKLIATFRSRVAAQQYQQIYQSLSADAKKTTSEADFIKMMQKAAQDLGPFKSAEQQGFKTTASTNSMSTLTLTFRSEYTRATVTETFVFQKPDSGLVLAGYHYQGETK